MQPCVGDHHRETYNGVDSDTLVLNELVREGSGETNDGWKRDVSVSGFDNQEGDVYQPTYRPWYWCSRPTWGGQQRLQEEQITLSPRHLRHVNFCQARVLTVDRRVVDDAGSPRHHGADDGREGVVSPLAQRYALVMLGLTEASWSIGKRRDWVIASETSTSASNLHL